MSNEEIQVLICIISSVLGTVLLIIGAVYYIKKNKEENKWK